MKKFILILSCFMFATYINAADLNNVEKTKYKSVPKKDWEEYQKYKEEQENNVFISEEEYEEYKQYKKNLDNNKEKDNSINSTKKSINENKVVSDNLFIGIDKTLHYDINLKLNDFNSSVSKGDGWGVTAEFGHRENGIMFGVGINVNSVDSSTFTNLYPYINLIFPLLEENNGTNIDFFFGGAVGYGHYSEKETVNGIDISCTGTFFWRLSLGMNINNLVFFMNYSTNHINVDAYSAYYGTKLSGTAKYEKFSIGVGYRFIL